MADNFKKKKKKKKYIKAIRLRFVVCAVSPFSLSRNSIQFDSRFLILASSFADVKFGCDSLLLSVLLCFALDWYCCCVTWVKWPVGGEWVLLKMNEFDPMKWEEKQRRCVNRGTVGSGERESLKKKEKDKLITTSNERSGSFKHTHKFHIHILTYIHAHSYSTTHTHKHILITTHANTTLHHTTYNTLTRVLLHSPFTSLHFQTIDNKQ